MNEQMFEQTNGLVQLQKYICKFRRRMETFMHASSRVSARCISYGRAQQKTYFHSTTSVYFPRRRRSTHAISNHHSSAPSPSADHLTFYFNTTPETQHALTQSTRPKTRTTKRMASDSISLHARFARSSQDHPKIITTHMYVSGLRHAYPHIRAC